MKAILIFILLGLTFSYDRIAAANYALKHCNNYNPNYNKYETQKEESANFVSQCMSIGGGQDFEGCEGRDDKGMFKDGYALKNCLISKGWKKTNIPQKGNPVFYKLGTYPLLITEDGVINHRVTCCSHKPDRCNARQTSVILQYYTL